MEHNFHDEENNIKNLSGQEAIDLLKKIAEGARICMFTTFSENHPLPSRPMALQAVDNDGTLHFLSAVNSDKNAQIVADPYVQLFFENSSASEYLSIYGQATISHDREKIKELWTSWAKAWFQEGPEDPMLTLISVRPDTSSYWDTKHNKMVSLFKIVASMVSGKVMDDGVEGKLNI